MPSRLLSSFSRGGFHTYSSFSLFIFFLTHSNQAAFSSTLMGLFISRSLTTYMLPNPVTNLFFSLLYLTLFTLRTLDGSLLVLFLTSLTAYFLVFLLSDHSSKYLFEDFSIAYLMKVPLNVLRPSFHLSHMA